MRTISVFDRITALCLVAAAAAIVPVSANVVTLDATAKTASSDTDALEPIGVQARGEQVGVYIQNTTPSPQSVTLRVRGLKDGTYDVYLNRTALQAEDEEELLKASGGKGRVFTNPGELIAARTRAQLEEGLVLSIPGDLGQPDLLRCLKAVRPAIEDEYRRLQMFQGGEHKRVWHTIAQAADWVRSAIAKDEAYRSVSVILTPAGEKPARMSWRTRLDAKETVAAFERACHLLHMARARMSQVISDQALRASAVRALTPVEFAAVYTIDAGKARVRAELMNSCNIPVSGFISLDVPKGWKLETKNLEFRDVKPGETFSVPIVLTPASAGTEPPASIAVAANVVVSQVLDPRVHFESDPAARPYAAEFGPREYRAELKLRLVVPRQQNQASGHFPQE